MSGSKKISDKNLASFRGYTKPPALQVDSLRVPGMAHLLIFWTLSGNKTPTVTGRKGHTNKTRASSEMAGLEEV